MADLTILRAARRRRRARHVARLRALLADVKAHPCEDCGRRYPPYVMDLDHVRGVKVANVSALVAKGAGTSAVVAEIAKCDLVCANCHRQRTHERAVADAS